jgi:hypothetical protein
MGVRTPGDANKHDKIPDLLQHTEDPEITKAGEKLGNLRGERNRADYNLADEEAEEEAFARLRLADAMNIIAALNQCSLGRGNPESRYEKAKVGAKKRADFLFLGIIRP